MLSRLALYLAITLSIGSQAVAGYYPTRPQNATIYTMTGILTWFGRGNDAGTIKVRNQSGIETVFRTARSVAVNGIR
jgi:hypothetical protein